MAVYIATSCYLEESDFVVLSNLIKSTKIIKSSLLLNFSLQKMGTLRNKRKLAAFARKTQEELPRNGQSRNTLVSRINKDYVTQFPEESKGRFIKKMCHDFSRTESGILDALSKLDEFPLNPQVRTQSGTVPRTSWNTDVENQERNADRSLNVPHPEVGSSVYRSHHSVDSDQDEAPH